MAQVANSEWAASTNPLFADFTQHNMNVFTIVDNFEYVDGKMTKQLEAAVADYHVIGFHSDADDDPMQTAAPTDAAAKPPMHSDRLDALRMALKDTKSGKAPSWVGKPASSRTLCHATMYDVGFDRDPNWTPGKVLAETAGQQLSTSHSIAVGTTPMDALLTYCRAHQDRDRDSGAMGDLEQDLLRIQVLLNQAEDDDVDGLQAAADEQYEQAFNKFDSGTEWKLKQQGSSSKSGSGSGGGGALAVPLPADIKALADANVAQKAVDTLDREVVLKQWYLFAEWWNFVSGFFEGMKTDEYQARFQKWNDRLDALALPGCRRAQLSDALDKLKATLTQGSDSSRLAQATCDRFFQRRDPTLLFAKIARGWDADFSGKVQVRLDDQVLTPTNTAQPPAPAIGGETAAGWENCGAFFDKIMAVKKIPAALRDTMRALLSEFFYLRKDNYSTTAKTANLKGSQVIPWFHDEDARSETRSRDLWQGTQPWRPIFVEWEALYYDIPFDNFWKFKSFNRYSDWGATTVHYGVDGSVDLSKANISDIRQVSGRNYLLPEAASTLSTTLDQIFKNTPAPVLKGYGLDPDKQRTMTAAAKDLETVSFPMTGLTSHLVTMVEGNHVKPLIKFPNKKALVIQEAANALIPAILPRGVTGQQLVSRMDAATSATPYGDLPTPESASPMKPVTHGQLVFTKMNIIDKFGQAICAIDPSPRRAGGAMPTLFPALSDSFFPGTLGDVSPAAVGARPNIVAALDVSGGCPCISLPPAINQPARLNAKFLLHDSSSSSSSAQKQQDWRSSTDWDNPVVGWLVVNYADYGLQIFLDDGTFYREVRVGGAHGTSAQPRWLPFDPPRDLDQRKKDNKVRQLDYLIDRLATRDDTSYLQGFVDMINQCFDVAKDGKTLPHAPATYASYASAIVGKPLALVSAGWSLELATEENRNWSTWGGGQDPPKTLLKRVPHADRDDTFEQWDPDGKDGAKGYSFKMKLGDFDRSYDGLVGYFPPSADPASQGDWDLDHLFTYFMDKSSSGSSTGGGSTGGGSTSGGGNSTGGGDGGGGSSTKDPPKPQPSHDPRVAINESNYPSMYPYYLDALGSSMPPDVSYRPNHDAYLVQRRLGLLVDPFLPVHAYTALLPTKKLQLPPAVVDRALSRMTAFWRAGPLLLAGDVPVPLPADSALGPDYASTLLANPAPPSHSVGLPVAPPAASAGGAGASYRWLQPYWDAAAKVSHFAALGIAADSAGGGDAAAARLPQGPYTAVEGFLQIAKPLATDSGSGSGSGSGSK